MNLPLLEKDEIWHQSLLQAIHSEVVLRILEIGRHGKFCEAFNHYLSFDTILDFCDLGLCTRYGHV